MLAGALGKSAGDTYAEQDAQVIDDEHQAGVNHLADKGKGTPAQEGQSRY